MPTWRDSITSVNRSRKRREENLNNLVRHTWKVVLESKSWDSRSKFTSLEIPSEPSI